MLSKIIQFAIQQKLIVGLLTLVLIGSGIYALKKLPIDAVPDITNNQVQVITTVPSLGAPDVERFITFPIEQANANIPGLQEIRSFSRFGLSLVTIVFTDETDIYWARQQVAERLQQVQSELPPGMGTPVLAPVTTGLGEIYQYVLRPLKGYEKQFDATALRTIQDWIVRRQLLGVKGVADVSSFGGNLKQYEVAVLPERLHAMGVTIADVLQAVEKNNHNTGGAYIEKGPTVQFIRSEGLIQSAEDIKQIIVKYQDNGIPILIRDLATVQVGQAIRYGAMCYNDQGEVAGAVVMMLKGANSSAVIQAVKERVEEIKKTLPTGVTIEPFLDRTKMVNNAIHTVQNNLMEGALIVIFVLVLFLGNLRAGLITASVIPLSMLFAIIMMNLFGVSGNLMSLGAIDFGLIVDGAVIIVEGVLHTLATYKFNQAFSQAQIKSEINDVVHQSASRLMRSSMFGQLIILIVYLPIFSLEGIEGKMFKPMAQTVTFALLGAFVLSLTYVPMMTALFIKPANNHVSWSDKMMLRIEHSFGRFLQRLMHYPKLMVGAVLGAFIIAIIILSQMGGEFIPALEEGDFAVDTRVLTGSNLRTTISKTQQAAGILKRSFPEVEKVVTKIGSGEIPTDPMPIEASDMMVILKPKKEWTSATTFNELSEKMSAKLEEIPGITAGFQYPVQMRFNELMTGARQDVVCKIFGENLDTLAHVAEKLGKVITTVKGTENLYIEPIEGVPQIVISYYRDRLAQYGMSIADVNETVHTALAGQTAGLIFEGEKRFDVVVRLQHEARTSIEDIAALLVATPSGMQIPLSQIASVQFVNSANQIQREDAKRRIVVGFNVGNRDVQSIVEELQQKVGTTVHLPSGYYIRYGGSFENLQKAKDRLLIAVPIALLLILLMLYFAFNSIKHSLLVYSAIPLSAIGGILLLAARGMPFSISAGIGFIALFGVAVLNGIVLISEFNRLRDETGKPIHEVVIAGTLARLRPVLMTASVASLGFIPMAISNGSGAEVQRPLATVVIGGLISATFLTLFLLPVLYTWFEQRKATAWSIKHLKIKKINMWWLLFLSPCASKAQQAISIQEALQKISNESIATKIAAQYANYWQQQKMNAKEIAPTQIGFEGGQFNSIQFDTKLSIAQSIPFPKIMQAQQQYYAAQIQKSNAEFAVQLLQLHTEIKQVFVEYVITTKKIALLQQTASMFEVYARKARIRLEKGETDIIETTSCESQFHEIELQLATAQQMLHALQVRFNILLNDANETYVPITTDIVYNGQSVHQQVTTHPSLLQLRTEKELIASQQQITRTQLLPSLSIGFNNQSIIGWQKIGVNDKYFNAAHRFTSGVFNLNVPLFMKQAKQRVHNYSYLMTINDLQQMQQQQLLQAEKNNLQMQMLQLQQNVSKCEQQLLPKAELLEKTAQAKLQQGDIDYFKWALLIQQSIQIKSNYLDQVLQLNRSIIQFEQY